MTFQEGLHSVVAGADLRWLRGCSTVQKIRLLSSTGESDRAQALRDALADALPAVDTVEVVVREQAEEEDGNYGGSSGDDSSDGDSSGADSSESDTSDSEWQQRQRDDSSDADSGSSDEK
jgi:hypothetical protein